MSIYKEKTLSPGGPEITFPDSIDFIIQAMVPGIGIFDKTEEIPAVPMILEAPTEKNHLLGHLSGLCDQNRSSAPHPTFQSD